MSDKQVAIADTSVKTPNFLIIGAAKSGTTAYWHYLKQHPEVYMPDTKHIRFFAFEREDPDFNGPPPPMRGPAAKNTSVPYAIADIGSYHALFDGVTSETAIGEASHSYLYQPIAAKRIRDYALNIKLIAILRNPAERAFSHHRQMVRDGREPTNDFVRALTQEEARIRDNWWPDFHYVRLGLYYEQLRRYFDLFAPEQIKVYLYEDLNSSPRTVMQDTFRFLGVDDGFVPDADARYNASGVPRNKALHASLKALRRTRPVARRLLPGALYRRLLSVGSDAHNRNLTKAHLAPNVRRRVIEDYFRQDVLDLERLLQRDLSVWLR